MSERDTTTLPDIAAEMAKALEMMIEYSHRPEHWQDGHEEYPEAAEEALTQYEGWKNAIGN
jgi:hypothetical protein